MSTDTGRQCTVSGGSGSTEAYYADLRSAADRLDVSGGDASDLCKAALGISTSLPEKSAILSPGSALSVAAQITGLTIDLGGLSLRMEFVARTLRWSATVYELTDTTQRALLAAINVVSAPARLAGYVAKDMFIASLEHSPSTTDIRSGVASWAGGFVEEFDQDLRADPTLVDGVVPWAQEAIDVLGPRIADRLHVAAPPGDYEGQLAWVLAAGRSLKFFNDTKPLSVSSATVHRTPAKRRQLGDLMQDAADVEHRSNGDHSVLTVRRIVGKDGTGSWVVAIPGTTHWSLFTDHGPSDATANLATMAGVPSSLYPAISRALRAAMKEAGVTAGTEPVMLTGHSQGGIVAAQLAADKTFRTKYDVREVVTTGAPIGRIAVPDDVNVLSIENRHDAVPHLDGRANPDSTNRVEVSCGTPNGEQLHDLLDAHDASRYARSARELTADRGDAQLAEWYARNDRFLDGWETDYEFWLRRD